MDTLKAALNAVIKNINKGCLATGVFMLTKQWELIINYKRGYMEGM